MIDQILYSVFVVPVAVGFAVAVDVETAAVEPADVGLAGAALADVELVDAGIADAETAGAGIELVDVGLVGAGLSVGVADAFVAVVEDVDAAVDIAALGEPVASVENDDIALKHEQIGLEEIVIELVYSLVVIVQN